MEDEMQYSLLDDPIIEVRFTDGKVDKTNLPGIFCALLEDSILSFEALQPHQQQPWFSFLVQIAAMAVAREMDGEISTEPATWRKALINLADGSEAAWHLVVEEVSQPAFMQSPVPEGSLEEAEYKSDIRTPDELDMLVTSKNHDLKGNRVLYPKPEYWLYALLTLQTMEGFLGRGNYGIVRMNGGFGNRPFVGLAPKLSWGVRFNRDLNVLLSYREKMLTMYNAKGHALLWMECWNGTKASSISLADCDPYFMEICRRIRLIKNNGDICCYRTNTKASRILTPDDLNGQTQDPWTPIEKKGVKALTLGESGFTYKLLQQLLLGEEYTTPIALEFQGAEQNGAFLITQALVRGQGKTGGLHQRIVPVPPKVSSRLFDNPSSQKKLAKRAQERVALTSEVQKKILYPAIASLLSSGKNEKIDYEKLAPWIDRFDQAIDDRFFESLWASVEVDPDEARKRWQLILLEEAEKLLREAERSIPIADLRRLRAVSQARSIFYGRCRDILELAYEEKVTVN
jgi:CRISPR system Cascade subunit CasA